MENNKQETNIFAILALVLAIISLFMSLYNIIPIAAIVLGVIALTQNVTGKERTWTIVAIVVAAIDFIINFFALVG